MRVTRLIETYRWEAGCEKWNIFIWSRLRLELVAGCSLLVPQKVKNFLTNFTSVRFSITAQNGIGYCLKFLERYAALQAKIEVYLDMSPCRLLRRYRRFAGTSCTIFGVVQQEWGPAELNLQKRSENLKISQNCVRQCHWYSKNVCILMMFL